jgi:transcriptional regulator with XRE-family HTH domain
VSSLFPERYSRFLEQLIVARKKAGLTQTQVALALKKPQSFVSKYESGERLLDVAEYIEIARVLGSDALKLIGRI